MPSDSDIKPLSASQVRGPEQHFAAYCEAELECRRNSGKPFDEEAFKAAAELVLRKLRAHKEGVSR